MNFAALLVLLGSAAAGAAEVDRFPSGLIRSFSATTSSERTAPPLDSVDATFEDFLQKNFEQGKNGLNWHLDSDQIDNTHRHRLYSLQFQGRRVLDQYVKLHMNRAGFIEFATSTWSARFLAHGHRSHQPEATAIFQKGIAARFGLPLPALKSEAAYQVDEATKTIHPVLLFEAGAPHPVAANRWIVDELSGKTLDERSGLRFLHGDEPQEIPQTPVDGSRAVIDFKPTAGHNCYIDSPDGALTSCYHRAVTDVGNPNSSTFVLAGPYLDVVRGGTQSMAPVSVKINQDYTALPGWDNNVPVSTTYDCVGPNADDCPSLALEAQNVHANLSNYRKKIIDYINVDLGLTSCGGGTCFPADPLKVIVNAQPISSGGGNVSVNNAAFIPNCSVFGQTSCLVFFKPATVPGSSCGSTGTVTLYSVAREANVVIHEFQHYVTDSITKIAFASSNTISVGDALHEGYSDYFAASHVVSQSGSASGAKILGYSFKNCPTVPRDVAKLRPFQVDGGPASYYQVGSTWASGLYQLRSEFDTIKHADLLAVKSLFFLTPTPGYIEAVEALVKADQALYDGTHVSRIRELFYTELKFINGQPSPFRNTDSLVAEVGFKSCTSLSGPLRANPLATFGAFGMWMVSLLSFGRVYRRRKEPR